MALVVVAVVIAAPPAIIVSGVFLASYLTAISLNGIHTTNISIVAVGFIVIFVVLIEGSPESEIVYWRRNYRVLGFSVDSVSLQYTKKQVSSAVCVDTFALQPLDQ